MELIITNDVIYKNKWDDFVNQHPNGSHLQLSDWLQSYKSYGFNSELVLLIENDKIVGGFGAVIAKILFFKFYIIPYGPIVENENNQLLNKLLDELPKRAKSIKACYCQFSFPIYRSETLKIVDSQINLEKYNKGNLFKYVYSSNGLNWLDFNKYNSTEEILLDFKSSVRRDIRSSERKGQTIEYLNQDKDIEFAYNLCLENAKSNNYSIRDWNSFKPTILALISKNRAKFIASYKDGDLKGVLFLVKTSNFYTYILGGTKKEKPDLLTGHFLQWEAIKMSFEEKCEGYNISLGGSKGVVEFKSKFNTKSILFDSPHYHIILRSILFKVYLILNSIFVKNKKTVSVLLKRFK